MSTIGHGWDDSDICNVSDGQLVFTGDGIIVNRLAESISSSNTSVEAEYTYKGLDLGLILWYNDSVGYIKFLLSPTGISVIRTYNGNEITLKNIRFEASDITAPTPNDTVVLRSELYRTNIKCYYNGTLVFNFEQSVFTSGVFGMFGSSSTSCNYFLIKSNTIKDWSRSLQEGSHILLKNDGVEISNNLDGEYSYIYQDIPTTIGHTYTLTVPYSGKIRLEVFDGSALITQGNDVAPTADIIKFSLTFVATTASTQVRIGSNTSGTSFIMNPQFEEKAFATTYTKDQREDSHLSFPAEKVNRYSGGVCLWVTPRKDYSTSLLPIFYYNDGLKLDYDNGTMKFTYGDSTVNYDIILSPYIAYNISCVWNSNGSLSICIFDGLNDNEMDIDVGSQTIDYSENIMIGCSPTSVANTIIDSLIVYAGETTIDKMRAYRNEDIPEDNRIVIQTDFENFALSFSKNKITVPNPKPCYPILVEDSDGAVYERVYFLYNGEYVLYDTKTFTYSKSKSFKTKFDSILSVEAYTDQHSKDFTNISTDGGIITINDLTDDDIGENIIIKYTPRDVFCANYDTENNGYEIQISNTTGKDIIITYENVDGADSMLINTVETNPFKAVNNNGFVYVVNVPQPVISLDVKATPEAVIADGYQTVTLTVDCVTSQGTPTSNANIVVSNTKYGTISKYVSDDEQQFLDNYEAEKILNGEQSAIDKYGYFITDEHRSGRFIFKYKVNNIAVGGIFTEKIVITDTKTGIGTEVLIKVKSII